jgi:hypothetical protein
VGHMTKMSNDEIVADLVPLEHWGGYLEIITECK